VSAGHVHEQVLDGGRLRERVAARRPCSSATSAFALTTLPEPVNVRWGAQVGVRREGACPELEGPARPSHRWQVRDVFTVVKIN
jgi:hypothetical protein